MILVVAVVLWIVWVAPYVLRNRRHQFQPAGDFLADTPAQEKPEPAGLVLNVAAKQEKTMDTRKSAGPAAKPSAAATGRLRIHYGRTSIALLGLLSLVTALVSAVLLPFGLGSPALPLICAGITAASVVLLRALAVRRRKAKVNAAFRSAMGAAERKPAPVDRIPPKPQAAPAPARPESPVFDAEAHQPRIKPLTAGELREAALAVAIAAGDTSAAAPSSEAPSGTPWEPVEIPKPVYVEAAKAERPEPKPLELPEAPKATGKPSLKQGAAADAQQLNAPQLTKAQSALSNLDDVLQRRRA
ncbi:hypothetical protein GA0061083_0868 [Pseudarthrobacter enclensis]|uniref:Uncharacterized protein n=1 Tax=Pseudarthrobacter enclensis TaxID=993070 RepID=A0A0V8IW97_9MICC|nr:hypothetical protein [Pseudarthrobacter enclensis]KSU78989.1 hypothetical protein AS031_02840 [Pseudarthrobacter enclensis]SCB80887.1 hypothetical protein GA0061083_0868 [Pseudarthrobacter enclensis]